LARLLGHIFAKYVLVLIPTIFILSTDAILRAKVTFTKPHCLAILLAVDSIFETRQLPCNHVSLAIVLGGLSFPVLGAQMNNLDDLVDEHNDLILQTLCSVRKLSNPANRVHNLDLLAWKGQINTILSLGKTL